MAIYYAHSLENEPQSKWEPLEDHLRRVAELAGEFAAKFEARGWGYLAGLWQDLGKYSERFQEYLRRENGLETLLEGGWSQPIASGNLSCCEGLSRACVKLTTSYRVNQ